MSMCVWAPCYVGEHRRNEYYQCLVDQQGCDCGLRRAAEEMKKTVALILLSANCHEYLFGQQCDNPASERGY